MWFGCIGPGGFHAVVDYAGTVAVMGAVGFPIGLPGVIGLYLPPGSLFHYFWYFVFGGYSLYLVLSVMGLGHC